MSNWTWLLIIYAPFLCYNKKAIDKINLLGDTTMFINCSSHPHDSWDSKQLSEATKFGEVVDLHFPNVDPNMSDTDLDNLANDLFVKIKDYNPDMVMIQGEFTLTYRVINLLKNSGIVCVAACSERKSHERVNESGATERFSVFEFVQFRKY